MRCRNAFLNSSQTPNKHNVALSEKSLQVIQTLLISKHSLRLRYTQLMNDAKKILGRQEAIDFIKETEVIWQKLIP